MDGRDFSVVLYVICYYSMDVHNEAVEDILLTYMYSYCSGWESGLLDVLVIDSRL